MYSNDVMTVVRRPGTVNISLCQTESECCVIKMESGSLLELALSSQKSNSETASTTNVLVLDLYPLELQLDRWQRLRNLAKLASTCNAFLQANTFHWHFGGDGPVFGVHVGDEGIPHLRAYCRYGPNVADEWIAIERMLRLSKDLEDDVAISCWDVEDGPIILIQTAEFLPDWFDQDPTDTHRHACWIRGGMIQLLSTPHISLQDALNRLRGHNRDSQSAPSNPQVTAALQRFLLRNHENAVAIQRAPLVVPRWVVSLVRHRPDLVHAAIQAFANHIDHNPPNLLEHKDWVWTTASISRTNYAMLRTMVSSEWSSTDFLPPTGVEVKRFVRQCKMDSTPHLQHAVQLGVRLLVGLEHLSRSSHDTMSIEKRIINWSRIEAASQGDGVESSTKEPQIWEAFRLGPDHSPYDLTDILKCPVFPEEADNPTLYSYPEVSIKQQILNGRKGTDTEEAFPMPMAEQVDDETWLSLVDGNGVENATNLDTMLGQFQHFMTQPSDIGGVVPVPRQESRRDIRPRVFVNLLHAVLRGEKVPIAKAEDPFFYQDDYDLMEPDMEGDHPEESQQSTSMRGLMNAMDKELQEKCSSRELDGILVPGIETETSHIQGANREVAENVHVLSNLLQSLEASAGESGPVPNMLKGMEPPQRID